MLNRIRLWPFILLAFLLVAGVLISVLKPFSHYFGTGYAPVTGYQTQTTSRVSATATTIPVASVKDKAGNAIVPSNISASSTVRMYFNFEAGTPREEPFYCTGISGLNLTNCVRGISFQGSDLTSSSTIAQIHNAGSSIIMTNLGVMYGNEFVGVSGAITKFDTLTFDSFPRVTSTTAIPSSNDQLTTWYAANTLIAGGFSSLNVSSSQGLAAYSGLSNCATSGTCVGAAVSTTQGVKIGTDGKIATDFSTFLGSMIVHGAWTFAAGLASIFVPTPTDPGHAANKSYVDLAISFNQATATAVVALTNGQAVYGSATGTYLMPTDTDIPSSTFAYVGIVASGTNAGQTAIYTKPAGVNCNQSGLTPGLSYYLNGASGQIATTAGVNFARVGIATTANCIQLSSPKFIYTGDSTSTTAGDTSFVNTWFYPSHITFTTGTTGTSSVYAGFSIGDDTNVCVLSPTNVVGIQTSLTQCAWKLTSSASPALQSRGTVAKSQFGFTLTNTTVAGPVATALIHWTAWSE